jgi:hypothetical protein
VLFCAGLTACLLETGEPDRPDLTSLVAASTAASPGAQVDAGGLGSGDKARPTHLPCAIEGLIMARCKNCHAPSTQPNRPVSLLSYEELSQPSKSVPGSSYAQQAEQMIRAGMMPPTGALAAADVQLFADWLRAGMPRGECIAGSDASDAAVGASDAGPANDAGDASVPVDASAAADAHSSDAGIDDPYAVAPHCTSAKSWTGGEMRSPLMHPGRACITCHTMGTGFLNLLHGPSFTIAGTVYPSAHEPDDCNGAPGNGVSIVIKGATGSSLMLTPNTVGNFSSLQRVSPPYMVEIHAAGRVRAAATPHQNGDCNSCHSQQGGQGAPGRLLMP